MRKAATMLKAPITYSGRIRLWYVSFVAACVSGLETRLFPTLIRNPTPSNRSPKSAKNNAAPVLAFNASDQPSSS